MRNPPYFARMRRSSIHQPRANPTASVISATTVAAHHDGRAGIKGSSWNRGGGVCAAASRAAEPTGVPVPAAEPGSATEAASCAAAGLPLPRTPATSAAAASEGPLPGELAPCASCAAALMLALAAASAVRVLLSSASSCAFSFRTCSSSAVRAATCSRRGGSGDRYDAFTQPSVPEASRTCA